MKSWNGKGTIEYLYQTEYFWRLRNVFWLVDYEINSMAYKIIEYLSSTFQPFFSQQSDGRTIKAVSPSILAGEKTDATIGLSIFDLPVENLQKLCSGN